MVNKDSKRINLRLPEALYADLKVVTAERGVTVTSQIIEYISDGIAQYKAKKALNERLNDPDFAGQLLMHLGINKDEIIKLSKEEIK